MIGNFIYKPKKGRSINFVDIENFVFGLLADTISGSGNVLLSTKTKIDFESSFNLGDLYSQNGQEVLITFKIDAQNAKNVNWKASLGEGEGNNNVKVAYNIYVIMKNDKKNSKNVLEITQILVDALTNNLNSISGTALNYQAPVPSGKILSSPLSLNMAEDFPLIEIKEDTNQKNYLTATINILFIINRIS
jgi:hypothetical protein